MSKWTKSPLNGIIRTAGKLAYYGEKIQNQTGKQRHRTHQQITGLKRTLRHLSKLYVWGVQG